MTLIDQIKAELIFYEKFRTYIHMGWCGTRDYQEVRRLYGRYGPLWAFRALVEE